ncbi:MAG: hypothetical protein HY710_04725 [Candidatus Latescibacteria bacterium]|nr:hypothetical protein [Candidatus Latescibacterota bacterium]
MEALPPILERVSQQIVNRRLSVPAILFLESMKPLSFLGGQLMAFFGPFVHLIVDAKSYDAFAEWIERRENVERLIRRIEDLSTHADR